MTTVTVDETSVGTIIATDGMLTDIILKTVPTQYSNDYFSLVSQDIGKDPDDNDIVLQETLIFHMHVATSHVSAESNLMAGGRVLFANLFVKELPPGCTLEINYGTPPDPPTLESIDPDTAETGGPPFTLACIGTGFTADSVIKFGDLDLPTTFVGDTKVTFDMNAVWPEGTYPVQVRVGSIYTDPIDFTFTSISSGD